MLRVRCTSAPGACSSGTASWAMARPSRCSPVAALSAPLCEPWPGSRTMTRPCSGGAGVAVAVARTEGAALVATAVAVAAS